MIRLERIDVNGASDAGPFGGSLQLFPGLQVISAPNSYGKSLAATTIVWCLGAEALLGQDNDPACFPLAAREEIELDGRKAKVIESECSVNLAHSDGRRLRLSRDIKGDLKTVRVQETFPDGVIRESKLIARFRSMQDEHGGLQRFLVEWIGWPRKQVSTFKGTFAEVYLENLVPLFYIEQQDGWTDLQARQVTRYAQQQIAQISVEYLLGAIDALESRVTVHMALFRDRALRERAQGISERVQALFSRHGWVVDWSGNSAVRDILTRWSRVTLRQALLNDADVDLAKERLRLTELAEKQRHKLTTEPFDASNISAPIDASQRVVDLKGRRHELNDELRNLRIQYRQAEELVSSLEHRIRAARDVLRLKSTGVGRFDTVECPTCHRNLAPETFSLSQQSQQSVSSHIEALTKDRGLIKGNVRSLAARLSSSQAEMENLDRDLRDAERTLDAVNETIGTVREQLVLAAAVLAKTERSMTQVSQTAEELSTLQAEIDLWLNEARQTQQTQRGPSDLRRRLDAFTSALGKYLLALGHSAVRAANVKDVRLDENYVPHIESRRLRTLGSASDKPRVVAAYSLALAAASRSVDGLHPGLVVFDEPLQQNPDDEHRDLFSEFLGRGLAQARDFQTVIFTSLRDSEIQVLREGGTTVVTPEGEHFLRRQALTEASPDTVSSS